MENEIDDGFSNKIAVYKADNMQRLEVRIDNETVWLNRQQLSILFDRDIKTIGKHINNALIEELNNIPTVAKFATVQQEGDRIVNRQVDYYNLDMILSIGYRVKSQSGVKFRIWANHVLKECILHGAVVNQRMDYLENRLLNNEQHVQVVEQKLDVFLQAALPPKQGVFFQGQIFDAYQFVADLIRSAKKSILLIDNYVDDSVLKLLLKRNENVLVIIMVNQISSGLKLDIQRHNAQYSPIEVKEVAGIHDRFLLLDETELYTFGASFKDLGKKLFCFSKIECSDVVETVRKLIIG